MQLDSMKPAPGSRRKRKRKGRGPGSGNGKTAGRGMKGQQSRSGGGTPPGFEGGQMPLYRRLPKRGFNNSKFRTVYAIVNVGQLDKAFEDGATVDAAAIRAAHLVNAKTGPIKVLGGGELSKKLTVSVDKLSGSARQKIEAAGGTVSEVSGSKTEASDA